MYKSQQLANRIQNGQQRLMNFSDKFDSPKTSPRLPSNLIECPSRPISSYTPGDREEPMGTSLDTLSLQTSELDDRMN